jgi:hypothetical protein
MSLGLLTRWRIYQATGLKNQIIKKELQQRGTPYLSDNIYLQTKLNNAEAKIVLLERELDGMRHIFNQKMSNHDKQ